MRIQAGLVLLVALFGIEAPAQAQPTPVSFAVRGIAWDSLRNAPLAGAFVVVSGTSKSTISDTSGRFQFDSLTPGRYVLTMQHDVLDSLGLTGVSARVVIATERDIMTVSIPSFATLWRGACGTSKAPQDSGFIYGTVRDSRNKAAVAAATVGVSWTDIAFDKRTGISQQRVGGKVQTDSSGGYSVCGIPNDVGIQVRANTDSAGSGRVELVMNSLRVRRVDLLMGGIADADSANRGFIAGALRGSTGQPVADARVVADGVPEARSDQNGRFLLRNVPIGTRQLEVVAIGLQPISTTVDVVARDTANVSLELVKVTALETVNVVALSVRERRKADFEEHRKLGIGKFLDSTVIAKRITIVGALMEAGQVRVDNRNNIWFPGRPPGPPRCDPLIWIDRQISDQYSLRLLNMNTIAAMEIYPTSLMIPPEFWGPKGKPFCVIVVWTKMYFP